MGIEDQKAKLVADAAKNMARSAILDLTLSAEEKQQKDEQAAAVRKKLLIKVVLGATAGVVVLITLLNVFAKLWAYLVVVAVVAGLGGAGYLYAKPRLKAWNDKRLAASRAADEERARAAALAEAEQQKALAAKKLEDDLARLKKQV